jgi:alanine-glyoxylate transaminase/serine-glyoxylate transaminase/serine-pyruvate transaminase
MSLKVAAPSSLSQPIHVPLKTMTGPGPSNVCDRVLQAQALPTIGHLHPEFTKVMDDIKVGVQYLFQTQNPMTLALSATGHAAMECVMTNMLEPGKVVLIANNGIWGVRSKDMAQRQGATVEELNTPTGSNFTLSELEEGVKKYKPDMLFVTHGESSTGVVQPLEGVGAMCHAHNCLLAVDTVASCGGVPLEADKLEIDVIYTGSQKVLGVPPGTAPISFSPRATEHFKLRKTPPRSFYLDLGWLGEYWNCWPGKGRVYHHTGPVNSMYALREGLAILAEEGLENCWRRHRVCADRLHEGLDQLGLQLFVTNPAARLPTVNTIKVPEGVDWKAVSDYCMQKHLVEISGGLGPTAGKVWRIGVMGNNANIKTISKVLDTFKEALATQGWSK